MNFKHLFPSFRNRYTFVKDQLKKLGAEGKFANGLNIGTGEGDYDRMVASYCDSLTANDVSEGDIKHAEQVNAAVKNLTYRIDDALNLDHSSESIDLVISSEVIEHVGKPAMMMKEIGRVLKPNAYAIMTFPSQEFPFTYDPINRIYHWVRGKKAPERLIAQGAYAFGHEYLIPSNAYQEWASENDLEIVEWRNLSGPLVGLVEVYWTGLAQSILKNNAGNVTEDVTGSIKVRPGTTGEPGLSIITDLFLALDRLLFGWWLQSSLGKGVVLRKKG